MMELNEKTVRENKGTRTRQTRSTRKVSDRKTTADKPKRKPLRMEPLVEERPIYVLPSSEGQSEDASGNVVHDLDKGPRPVKKAPRKMRRKAAAVRKEEARIEKIREENKRRKAIGKKLLDDGSRIKPSIWERIGEDKMYAQLREMQDSTQAIDKMQRGRVLRALSLLIIGLVAGYLFHMAFYFITPIFVLFVYKSKSKQVDRFYKGWKFSRQLNFSKFMRLVIPYLKAADGNAALYTVFNKILQRLPDESDRVLLYRLMGEMGNDPSNIQPFLDFANQSSGTDMSHLFMSTIFDFQQSTFDTQVIDELGEMASVDMMNSIDEIIELKLKRFVMFPTKVVMSSFILVAGLGVGMMIHNFSNMDMAGFSGSIAAPMETMTETEVTDEPELDIEIENLDEADVGASDVSTDESSNPDVYDEVLIEDTNSD